MQSSRRIKPLVSVIVTCTNGRRYLKQAIESVENQSYSNFEIVLVHDDLTVSVDGVSLNPVQKEKLSRTKDNICHARNRGIDASRGEYIVFLDSNDWLYAHALETNVGFLDEHQDTAFVSGTHRKVNDSNQVMDYGMNIVLENHYQQLLLGDYIEMHGAVMYQRWVFDYFRFDDSVSHASDYDMYLKISRLFPVHHHQFCTAASRVDESEMTTDIPGVYNSIQTILKRQKRNLQNTMEHECLQYGLQIWESYYCEKIFKKFEMRREVNFVGNWREYKLLFLYSPVQALKKIFSKLVVRRKNVSAEVLKVGIPNWVD